MADEGVYYAQTKNAIILDTAQNSSAVRVQGQAVIGLDVPANTEGANLALEGSQDGTNFLPIRRQDGTAEVVVITAAGGRFWLDPRLTMPWMYVRVVSSLVQAGGNATIGFIVRRIA